MKNKGFTLIELLGVILILGVLVIIAFPPLLKQIKKTKSGISDATKALIIDGAKDYIKDNQPSFETIKGVTYCIEVETLVEKNYVNPKLKDENLNDIDITKKVKVTYNNQQYYYEITDDCTENKYTANRVSYEIQDDETNCQNIQCALDEIYEKVDE